MPKPTATPIAKKQPPVAKTAPEAVTTQVSAPVETAPTTVSKKSSAPVKSEAVAETVVAVSAPAETPATEETLSGTELIIKKMQTQIAELSTQVHSAQTVLKTITTAMKTLEKEYSKERKEMMKKAEKYTRRSTRSRNPSGFAKSAPISKELADFLGLPHGSELARTDATRKINEYIKSNDLQNPAAKKEILCDAKLKELLQPADGEVVHFFNLQRFLKKHFVSTASAPVVAPVATA
jgi:chromatin remodeling complex protein RSC6